MGKLGGLHILVNNAGIIRRDNAIDFTEADWDAVLDVNLKSVFFLSQAAARHMIPAGGGKIINIASMLSFQGGIRVPSYTASKSGIAGLTKLLANEWAVSGINVNAIAPGYFATNNTVALQADVKRNAEILGRIPAGRWGDPQGSWWRGGVPGLERCELRAGRHPPGRRWLAGSLTEGATRDAAQPPTLRAVMMSAPCLEPKCDTSSGTSGTASRRSLRARERIAAPDHVDITWMSIANMHFELGSQQIVADGYITRLPAEIFYGGGGGLRIHAPRDAAGYRRRARSVRRHRR